MRLSALARLFWSQAWLVLIFMAIGAGTNGTAARMATDQVPPLVLVFLRWAIVCASLSLILTKPQWQELRALVRLRWRRLAWMGALGYAGFNALFYVAAYRTSAVNLTLLQSAIPALVLAGAALVFKIRIQPLQLVGMALTVLGVLIVSSKGHLGDLAAFRLDEGDALVLVACVFYAFYTLGLRARPAGTPIVFFAGMAFASLVVSIPIGAAEVVLGHAYWPTPRGWAITLFIAFWPSFAGQLSYMRGVDLIGPARAGLFANLIPIFGALSAVVLLHETFTPAHAAALFLGLAGVSLAEWPNLRRRPLAPRASDVGGEEPRDACLP